jgi:hypothetical protein
MGHVWTVDQLGLGLKSALRLINENYLAISCLTFVIALISDSLTLLNAFNDIFCDVLPAHFNLSWNQHIYQ